MTRGAWLALMAAMLLACQSEKAFSLRMARHPKTPANASVTIDEQYVGPLSYVAARGVRLRAGQHRVTVEKDGYFPYDQLIESDGGLVRLQVELTPIPD
jgi:hypothetical protein